MNDEQFLGLIEGEYGEDAILLMDEGQIEGLGKVYARNAKRVRKAKVRSAQQRVGGNIKNSRDEMQARMNLLSPALKQGLAKGTHQFVDATIYNIKSIAAETRVRLYEDTELKEVGARNISGGKLDKGEVFLLHGIRVLVGTGTAKTNTAADIATVTNWKELPAEMIGELDFRADGRLVLDSFAIQNFVHYSHHETLMNNGTADVTAYTYATGSGDLGYVKLANPKLLSTQTQLDMEVEWAKAGAENTFIKVELIGTKVAKH